MDSDLLSKTMDIRDSVGAGEYSLANFNRLEEKQVTATQLCENFVRLQNIKKPSSFNFFKKQVDVLEEDVLKLMMRFFDLIPPKEFYRFLVENIKEIQVFMGISFNPFNKNKQLAGLCMQACIKMMASIFEIYTDVIQMRRDFRTNDDNDSSKMSNLRKLFDNSICFLSLLFVSNFKQVKYKIKTEKLKIFANLMSRLNTVAPQTPSNFPTQPSDPYIVFKQQMAASLEGDDEAKLITMSQAWFEVVGEILGKCGQNQVVVKGESFVLEIETKIKHRNKIFTLLDHYFEILLAIKEQQVGLMSLMEKSIANYIGKVVDNSDDSPAHSVDLDLFKLIFKMINKLFQRRKKLFGTAMDEDELDYHMSGRSSDDNEVIPFMSTLSREVTDELTSFQYLQKMTGKLYMQLIDLLLLGPDTSSFTEYNIFSLFMNEEGLVSYIEIFEPIYSQKLIKRVLGKLKNLTAKSAFDSGLQTRLMFRLNLNKCSHKECSCFIFHFLDIFFKLAMKCQMHLIKEIMDIFYEILNNLLQIPEVINQISICFLNMFTKMFTSLMRQNLMTIDKMTIQLMTCTNFEPGENQIENIMISDLRRTISHNSKKFNLFLDQIGIDSRQIKLTKDMCESVLLALSDTHRVKEFLANQQYKIDLGFDEYTYVTMHDLIEAVQKRWQVKLLAFRTLLIELSAKVLKNLYNREQSLVIFNGYLDYFKQTNSKRGSITHSFYMGFATYVFVKEFNLTNYNCECFHNYLAVFDICLRGLGYYDRDNRISLPLKVQKDFMEYCLIHLKVKTEPQNIRLTILQMLICYRIQDMLTRDPSIIKCLVPLLFDISNDLLANIDKIDLKSDDLLKGVELILEGSSLEPLDAILVILMKILTSVLTITVPYSAYPIILKPHLLVSGRMVLAGGFPYKTFGDIKNTLLSGEYQKGIIGTIDKQATHCLPQVELSKYLNIAASYRPEVLHSIYSILMEYCLENHSCSDEVFKIRMRLFMSFLTMDKHVFTSLKVLTKFIDKCQDLLLSLAMRSKKLNSKRTLELIVGKPDDKGAAINSTPVSARVIKDEPSNNKGHIKKQWILTLLMKLVFLSAGTELPVQKLREMISIIKQTEESYLHENCLILESYLTAIKGLYTSGSKELRNSSYFDESNVMSRKKMHTMLQMIDKFCRNECIEEEARLLQQNFEANLFEFFSPKLKELTPDKLFEKLLLSVKPNKFKWTYLYDSKNIVLYSIAQTDRQELCLIKRHITGKNSWFLQEDLNDIFVDKEKLEVINPANASKMPFTAPQDDNNLVQLLHKYRSNPEKIDLNCTKSIDQNVLGLESVLRVPERISNVNSFPEYLKEYWDFPSVKIRPSGQVENINLNPIFDGSRIQNLRPAKLSPCQTENDDSGGIESISNSNADSHHRGESNFSERNPHSDAKPEIDAFFSGKNQLLLDSLADPCIRFIIQMEAFTQYGPNKEIISDFHLISPEGEKSKMFRDSLKFIDKSRIVNCFKVGILVAHSGQETELDILCNEFPTSGLFNTFVKNLGDKLSESAYAKYLGNDMIQYMIGPLIPRKPKSNFEVKRVVGNVPTLIIWTQSNLNNDFENIKSKFNRDIIIIEELPSQLMRIRSLRKIDDDKMDSVFLPDSVLTLNCLLTLLPSYIYASQMEINPIIFSALQQEYRSISPFLDARKKQLRKLIETNNEDTRRMTFDTLLNMIFNGLR